MERTLYLHVGPAKTGTSAIQAFLKASTFDSILYPKCGQWPDGAHHKLVFAARGVESYGVINIPDWNELKDQLRSEIVTTNKDVLISSEMCQPDFISAIQDIVSELRLNLKLIMVYRDALGRASSIYNQDVKDPVIGMSLDPDEFLKQKCDQLRIRPLYENWQNTVDDITVIPYSAETPLITRFCHHIGITVNLEQAHKIFNRSMGGHALITMLIANKILCTEEKRRSFFEAMRLYSDFRIWSGESYPFSLAVTSELMTYLNDDRRWIQQELGADFKYATEGNVNRKRFSLTQPDCKKIIGLLDSQSIFAANKNLVYATLKAFS